MKKELTIISIFSLILALMGLSFQFYYEATLIHSSFPWIVLGFWLLYLSIHFLMNFMKKYLEVPHHMILLAGTSMRLIIALFSLIVFYVLKVENLVLFTINFSGVYLLFLVFEISTTLSNLRPNSSEESNQ